jgi:uncharacterized oligopeptide transporter (OPT) family protein
VVGGCFSGSYHGTLWHQSPQFCHWCLSSAGNYFTYFIGGAIRGLVEYRQKKEAKELSPEEEELGKGNLFATGLVAGGAVAGVLIAILAVINFR